MKKKAARVPRNSANKKNAASPEPAVIVTEKSETSNVVSDSKAPTETLVESNQAKKRKVEPSVSEGDIELTPVKRAFQPHNSGRTLIY